MTALSPATEMKWGWSVYLALLVIAAITVFRIVGLWVAPIDLFVDEAQYWLWGQSLEAGYYSKPPMIGWVIHLVTGWAGSDATFWIRLPGPVFHAVTALLLMAIAQGPYGGQVAAWTGITYVTLPAVAVGSAVISTDTILFPFFAAALLGWFRLTAGGHWLWALFAGAMLGAAFLSKYAALYFWLGVILGLVLLQPPAWPGRWRFLIMVAAFGLVASPNLIWNWQNAGATVGHTIDNIGWLRNPDRAGGFHPAELAEFLGAQFGLAGPILFTAFLWVSWRAIRGRLHRPENLLLVFALPVLLLISGQALMSRAYANWAATAYLSGTVAVTALLWMQGRFWLWASLAVNLAVSVALPLALARAEDLTIADRLVFKRLLGRSALSTALLEAAERANVPLILASNRDVLADLLYTGRDAPVQIRAYSTGEGDANHYTQTYPYRGGATRLLWVMEGDARPRCATRQVLDWQPETGAYSGKRFTAWVVPSTCRGLP